MDENNKISKQTAIREILEKIKSGKVKMKSRSYFMLETAAIIFGIIFILGLAVFLSSAIHFFLHASGLWMLPGLGFAGLKIFFLNLPWDLIAVMLISGIGLSILIKQISSAYRQPIIYWLAAVFAVIFSLSIIFVQYPLHQKLRALSGNKNVPLISGFYQFHGQPPCADSLVGEIASTTEYGFIVAPPNEQDKEYNIIVSPKTNFPDGRKIKKGETILIIGNKKEKNIKAMGIKKFDPGEISLPPWPASCPAK